ncbi:MAG TPA: flagellar basal body rod protein FlgB [Terriglobales bacterium]|nr:flagellar basal body rod protein FlgB [Terriglobales bacterium]
MSLIDTAQINALTRFLDVTAQRHQAITNNIANVDTPGYHTKDVDFRNLLQAASSGIMPASSQPRLREVEGLMERPDGNNVSLEREGLALADTQLQFQAGVQLLRSEFRRLQTAINEGK